MLSASLCLANKQVDDPMTGGQGEALASSACSKGRFDQVYLSIYDDIHILLIITQIRKCVEFNTKGG